MHFSSIVNVMNIYVESCSMHFYVNGETVGLPVIIYEMFNKLCCIDY